MSDQLSLVYFPAAVILISAIGLWLGNEAFTGHAVEWLEKASGFVAIAIGSWMLYRRLFIKRDPQQIHAHHHAPNPVAVQSSVLKGVIEIIDTPLGERIRYTSNAALKLCTWKRALKIRWSF